MKSESNKYVYKSDEIGIRPYRPEDVSLLYDAARESIEFAYHFLPWCHPNYSINDAKQWVESCAQAWKDAEEYSFVIFELANKQFLGGVGINKVDQKDKVANLGYWIRKSALGKSYAVQASLLAAKFAFRELHLNRLEIIMAVDNIASKRVAEKMGAKYEGQLRKRLVWNDEVRDADLYSLTSDDL